MDAYEVLLAQERQQANAFPRNKPATPNDHDDIAKYNA